MIKSKTRRVPDFIGIGFRRCASSWLHACLREHPEIGKPPSGLHFFSEQYEKGLGWYETQIGEYSERIVGEFSVSYTYPEFYEEVARRIAYHYPGVKLFCTVRDPVERVYSDYLRSVSLSEIDQKVSFEEALKRWPVLVERGFYGRILKHYQKYFPGSLLVTFYDGLERDPSSLLRQIYSFVGANSNYVPSLTKKRSGESFVPKNQGVQRLITRIEQITSHTLRPKRLGFILNIIKALGIQKTVRALNRQAKPALNVHMRARIYSLYRKDMELLADLTDQEIPWPIVSG